MKKIIIEIPEDKKNVNNAFSYIMGTVKKSLSQDQDFEGKLAPLWNTKMISEYNLIKFLSEKLWREIWLREFLTTKKGYEMVHNCKISPVRNYQDISKSPVYLLDEIKGIRDYFLNETKSCQIKKD